jgi:hypothetical protein
MKKFLTLMMTVALIFGAAPVALAAEGAPATQTNVAKDRSTKLAEARAQRQAAIKVAKEALEAAQAKTAASAATAISQLDRQLESDLADASSKLPPKDAAARLRKLKKDHQTAVRNVMKETTLQRRAAQKVYADTLKTINATYKAAVKAAK